MATRGLWPHGRKQFLEMLERTEAMLEGGERLLSDDFLSDSRTSLLLVRAMHKWEKMLAFCLEQKRYTAAVFLALATYRMQTVTPLIPLLTLDGVRGVTFAMMKYKNWVYAMELVRSRPCL